MLSGPQSRPAGAPAVIAVDGGNSKTDVALIAADGSLLASVRGPGLDPQRSGVAETIEMLRVLVEKVAAGAGHHLPRWPLASHLCACVANADLPEEEEKVAAALRAQRWTVTTSVVNDTFAVLRAGLDDGPAGAAGHWGVAVTCGAGINCVAVAPDGRTHRYLALGTVSGDWGGGEGLGYAAVWWAMRAEDGRGPATTLREAIPAHFGRSSMHEVAVSLNQEVLADDDVVGLTPVLFGCADDGDQVARDLLVRQGEEITLMAVTAMRPLGLTELDTPVVLGGGLLTARHPLLLATIDDRLAAAAPRASTRVIDVPPVAGAALLGLDQVRATPEAHARLRAAYGDPVPADRPARGTMAAQRPLA